MIDKEIKFNKHLEVVCKKTNAKVTALARMVKIIPFEKKKLLMKSFIESQFSYCPLIWMFCSIRMNNKINYIHERALRLVYNDYTSTFQELLGKDESVCIHHRNIQYVAVEMFKVKNNLCPEILKYIFCLTGFRSTQNATFYRPNVYNVYNVYKCYKFSFL